MAFQQFEQFYFGECFLAEPFRFPFRLPLRANIHNFDGVLAFGLFLHTSAHNGGQPSANNLEYLEFRKLNEKARPLLAHKHCRIRCCRSRPSRIFPSAKHVPHRFQLPYLLPKRRIPAIKHFALKNSNKIIHCVN